MFQHLQHIENRILDSLAWRTVSRPIPRLISGPFDIINIYCPIFTFLNFVTYMTDEIQTFHVMSKVKLSATYMPFFCRFLFLLHIFFHTCIIDKDVIYFSADLQPVLYGV